MNLIRSAITHTHNAILGGSRTTRAFSSNVARVGAARPTTRSPCVTTPHQHSHNPIYHTSKRGIIQHSMSWPYTYFSSSRSNSNLQSSSMLKPKSMFNNSNNNNSIKNTNTLQNANHITTSYMTVFMRHGFRKDLTGVVNYDRQYYHSIIQEYSKNNMPLSSMSQESQLNLLNHTYYHNQEMQAQIRTQQEKYFDPDLNMEPTIARMVEAVDSILKNKPNYQPTTIVTSPFTRTISTSMVAVQQLRERVRERERVKQLSQPNHHSTSHKNGNNGKSSSNNSVASNLAGQNMNGLNNDNNNNDSYNGIDDSGKLKIILDPRLGESKAAIQRCGILLDKQQDGDGNESDGDSDNEENLLEFPSVEELKNKFGASANILFGFSDIDFEYHDCINRFNKAGDASIDDMNEAVEYWNERGKKEDILVITHDIVVRYSKLHLQYGNNSLFRFLCQNNKEEVNECGWFSSSYVKNGENGNIFDENEFEASCSDSDDSNDDENENENDDDNLVIHPNLTYNETNFAINKKQRHYLAQYYDALWKLMHSN